MCHEALPTRYPLHDRVTDRGRFDAMPLSTSTNTDQTLSVMLLGSRARALMRRIAECDVALYEVELMEPPARPIE